jgi:hypothetical protein
MESLSRILYSLFRGQPNHNDWVVSCLHGAWPRLVSERLAEVCRPLSFMNSELVVEILDPDWEQALRDVKEDLEEKLCAATGGEVRRVQLMLSR